MKAFFVAVVAFWMVGCSGDVWALSTCPDGEFIASSELPVTVTGNTCGAGDAYQPVNFTASDAPEHGYIVIMPAGPYRIRFESTGFAAVAEVMDVSNGDCVHGPYGFVTSRKPASPSGIYSGFDAPRVLAFLVDGQYRGCGDYSFTIESLAVE